MNSLKALLGFGEYSALSIAAGCILAVIGLGTGLAYGLPGLIFTSVLAILAVFVVAVATSPLRGGK